jgi:hypothetical protein
MNIEIHLFSQRWLAFSPEEIIPREEFRLFQKCQYKIVPQLITKLIDHDPFSFGDGCPLKLRSS